MIQTFDFPPKLVEAIKTKAKEKKTDKSKLVRAILSKQLGVKEEKLV